MSRLLLPLALCLTPLAAAAAVAATPSVVSQGPCADQQPCVSFGPSGSIPAARTIEATTPADGHAIASFHGTMFCRNTASGVQTLSLNTQIVGPNNTTPDGTANGGLIVASNMPGTSSSTFNLAMDRVFRVNQGQTLKLAYRISRIGMDASVTCKVQPNSGFVILFTD